MQNDLMDEVDGLVVSSGSTDQFWVNVSENSTNGTIGVPYTPYHLRPETYIVPFLFFLIFIVGVLGNGTLIVIFILNKNMRNIPNTYIFSLAIGDLLVILICVPFTSTVYTIETWPYGLVICKVSEFIKDVSIGVSVFTLTALSADRFFAIVDPMRKHAGRRATRLTIFTAVAIWVFAILCAVPAVLFSYVRQFVVNDETAFSVCYPFPEYLGPNYPKIITILKFLCYYAIPLCIIAFFYILMALHLIRSTRNLPGEVQGQARQIQARKKVAKMVLAFVIIFAICFFPQHVFMIWFYMNPRANEDYNLFWHILRIASFCLSFINSCINPIALYCVSGTFRKHFNKYLFCCLPERQWRQLNRDRTKSTWESSHSMVNYNSTLRRQDEFTVTTFMNGSGDKT